MLRFESGRLSIDARESLKKWHAAIMDEKWENQMAWGNADCQLVRKKLQKHANDTEWIMER